MRLHPFSPISLALVTALLTGLIPEVFGQTANSKPNVVFVAIDDLNHWVGYFGRNNQAKTPNLDRLAAMGVSFTNAHCAAPACNPSRAGLMSGLRPNTTGVYENSQDWKPHIEKEKTLTTQFLKAGYDVFGAGKIYHNNAHRDGEWTDYQAHGKSNKLKQQPHPTAKNDGVAGIKFQPLTDDSKLSDELIVDYGIDHLKSKHEKPFFLAIGLHKPHMPWNVPKRYYDLFPLETIQLPPTTEKDLADIPAMGKKMAGANGDHAKILESGRWKEAVQAYLASIAYCDEQIGRLLDAYDSSPGRDNTIFVLWGDHGWSLGEKEHWRKFALWEETTRMPLIWVAPGVTAKGQKCDAPVDLMSLYPTLCDLCSIEKPSHVEGENIRVLLTNPKAPWNKFALTTHYRNNHAIRVSDFRYIRYEDGTEELYDHRNDPYEWKNLASESSQQSRLVELRGMLPKNNAKDVPRGKEQ